MFDLLNVESSCGDRVSGYWLSGCCGGLKQAMIKALETKEVNGGRIVVAVVEPLSSTTPGLNYWENRKYIAVF